MTDFYLQWWQSLPDGSGSCMGHVLHWFGRGHCWSNSAMLSYCGLQCIRDSCWVMTVLLPLMPVWWPSMDHTLEPKYKMLTQRTRKHQLQKGGRTFFETVHWIVMGCQTAKLLYVIIWKLIWRVFTNTWIWKVATGLKRSAQNCLFNLKQK